MERYKELAALRCFTHDDMVQLAGSESSAVWQIKSYLQKGYIERVRRNLYAVISMETGQAIPNRYQIASRVTDDYLAAILKPEDTELSFWQAFAEGNYQPGLLFDDADILSRVEHHPMALWKCGGRMPK